MKRIVICADGTWNDPEDEIPTNVLRVARAVCPVDSSGMAQIVFYDWGVGSDRHSLAGGVSGMGIEKNIQDGYRFIVQNYDPGDELYLFGYSRGAYTVRALAGMLNQCGVIKRELASRIPGAFDFYKQKNVKPSGDRAALWRQQHAVNGSERGVVHFLGVWDTVGALGIPTRNLAFVDERDLFFDPVLGSNVLCARHAVSIDEKRSDFAPTLWENTEARDLRQVWFSGVHGDVGGGAQPRAGRFLGDIALDWMARQAAAKGLVFEPHLCGSVSDHHTVPVSRSHKGFWKLLGKRDRDIPLSGRVHGSVRRRYDNDAHYRPIGLINWLAANNNQWRLE